MAALNYLGPEDLRVGERVAAPVKKNDRRRYADVTLTWVSTDGRVVNARDGNGAIHCFSRSSLRPCGTRTPEGGYVVI